MDEGFQSESSPNGYFSVIGLSSSTEFQDSDEYLRARLALGTLFQEYGEENFDAILIDHSINVETLEAHVVTEFDHEMFDSSDLDGSVGRTMLNEYLPLLDGESEIEISFSKVPAPSVHYGFNAAQLYLVQETSIATVAVFLGMADVDENDEESGDADRYVDFVQQNATALVDPLSSVALSLAQALASQAGSLIWSEIEKQIFPDGNLPSYYKQVFAQMKKIIKEELTEKEQSDISALAKQFYTAINSYNKFGKKEVDLRAAESIADELISKSESTSYLGDKGAFLFAEGIAYHIMVLQEKYKREFVDPETKISDENFAEKGEAAREYIQTRARYGAAELRKMHQSLLQKRLAKISENYQYVAPFKGYGRGVSVGGVVDGVYFQDCYLDWFQCKCSRHVERSCEKPWECNTFGRGKEWPMSFPVWTFLDEDTGFWLTLEDKLLNKICKGKDHAWNWVNSQRLTYVAAIKKQTEDTVLSTLSGVAAAMDKIAANPVAGL
ncbi:MAG: hypothetical protein SGILL_010369 [Bacillariaceae sp.]